MIKEVAIDMNSTMGFECGIDKEVTTATEEGTVTWFNENKCFGFIQSKNDEHLFVRSSSIQDGLRTLKVGQIVSFSQVEHKRGFEAINVHIIAAPKKVEPGAGIQSLDPEADPTRLSTEMSSFNQNNINGAGAVSVEDLKVSNPLVLPSASR